MDESARKQFFFKMKIKKSINNRYFTISLSSKQQIIVLLCVMMLLIRKGYYNRKKIIKKCQIIKTLKQKTDVDLF